MIAQLDGSFRSIEPDADTGTMDQGQAVPPRVRPAFAAALTILAVPILVVFGFGFMNDEGVRWRAAIVLTYVVGAWLAPIVLAWRLIRQGVRVSDAVAAAIAVGVAVLAVDLSLQVSIHNGVQQLLLLAIGTAVALAASVWVRAGQTRVPPRPDLPS